MTEQVDGHFMVERRYASQRPQGPDATEHEREPANPEAEHPYSVHHEIHAHGVSHVLGSREACFDHREPGLHEHDHETADQRPYDVDRHFTMSEIGRAHV